MLGIEKLNGWKFLNMQAEKPLLEHSHAELDWMLEEHHRVVLPAMTETEKANHNAFLENLRKEFERQPVLSRAQANEITRMIYHAPPTMHPETHCHAVGRFASHLRQLIEEGKIKREDAEDWLMNTQAATVEKMYNKM